MKILLIGFLTFSIWSLLATHIYVCKILGLCDDSETTQIVEAELSERITEDSLEIPIVENTLEDPLSQQQATAPKDLVVYFAFDKSESKPDSTTEKYVDESKNYLDKNAQAMLRITGHTDAIGSDAYNQDLGYRRAQSMQHYFESNGIPSGKIILQSYGEKQPADHNSTTAGRANNRRTVITIKNE